jgi:hypothetical protein
MATRSTIAIENKDGSVSQVYCHWDGYLSGVGKTLIDHYTTPDQVCDLISHGDISSLGNTIGTLHPFSPAEAKMSVADYAALYDNMTTFYGRDRGEANTGPYKFWDFEMYRMTHQYAEFEYILRKDGIWYVCFTPGGAYTELATCFNMVDN